MPVREYRDEDQEAVITLVAACMYSHRDIRGRGWAQEMLSVMVDRARSQEYASIEPWSDVLFERAHAFYLKGGFDTDGETREGAESSQPYTEKRFYRMIG